MNSFVSGVKVTLGVAVICALGLVYVFDGTALAAAADTKPAVEKKPAAAKPAAKKKKAPVAREAKKEVKPAAPAPEPAKAEEKPALESTPEPVAVAPAPAAPAPVEKKAVDVKAAPQPKLDPSDPNNVIYLDTSGKAAGVGDGTKPVSSTWRIGMGWHPQALMASNLPKDKFGLVNWAMAVSNGVIRPKHSTDPKEGDSAPMDMDVLIETKSDFVDNVVYPHKMHTYWLKCENCHTGIFIPARGSNNMSMVGISKGEWCGRCHGKVAFPLADCTRCHSSPKKPVGRR